MEALESLGLEQYQEQILGVSSEELKAAKKNQKKWAKFLSEVFDKKKKMKSKCELTEEEQRSQQAELIRKMKEEEKKEEEEKAL